MFFFCMHSGLQLIPGPVVLRDSYIECESPNIGTPAGPGSWLAADSYGGRSRPIPWTNDYPLTYVMCVYMCE